MTACTATFEGLGLHSWIVKTCSELGFNAPTMVQSQCVVPILAGRNCIASAETGSGKTAAFVLPILHQLSIDPFGIFALIITPTRELAVQISEQIHVLGAPINVKDCVLIGGVDQIEQGIKLSRKPHFVVATPGRLLMHLRGNLAGHFKRIKFLVFDEADRLFEEHAEDISEIMDILPDSKTRQTLLFSATLSPYVLPFEQDTEKKPFTYHQSSELYNVAKTLNQQYMLMPVNVKHCYLDYLLHQFPESSIIIFTATCKGAALIHATLKKLKFKTAAMHSLLTQPERTKSLNQFKSQFVQILVATDVAARGLDIPMVELVINYDIPSSSEDYIHRIGRTARAGKPGRAISLVTQYDVDRIKSIEHVIDKKLTEYEANENDVLAYLNESTKALKIAAVFLGESEIEERFQEKMKVKRSNKRKEPPVESGGDKDHDKPVQKRHKKNNKKQKLS